MNPRGSLHCVEDRNLGKPTDLEFRWELPNTTCNKANIVCERLYMTSWYGPGRARKIRENISSCGQKAFERHGGFGVRRVIAWER